MRPQFDILRSLAAIGLLALSGCIPGCAAMSYLGYSIAPDYPRDESQTIALPGLASEVKVHLDPFGVPHVEAADEKDLMRAVGFLQGRDRFFQMDTMRRFARGRLSELVGEQNLQFGTSVGLDATMRGWGFEQLSKEDADSLAGPAKDLMQAFTDGVNAALARREPIEYRLLGISPEPWTIQDSFAIGRLVGWSISHNWHQELSRLVVALHAGLERGERIYPNTPWPGGASVKPAGAPKKLLPAVAPELRDLFPDPAPLPVARPSRPERILASALSAFGGASNAWVLGAKRSRSGKPLLANDPHMAHTLPSLMYQQHLACPGLDVIGITAPGLPYVLIGHNRKVAWGMTSSVADVIDLYLEKPDPENPGQVLGPKGPEPLTTQDRVILVRDGSKLVERRLPLRATARGPLVNDLYPDLLPEGAPLVSLRWNASGAGDSIHALGKANRAASVSELREAMLGIVSPVNSVQAADVHGAIALFPTGRLPKRKGHLGTFPAPAWLAAYDWDGVVASKDMPLYEAGPDGFFAHGNNLMFDPARGPVHLQIDSAPSYRLDRIVELIEAKPQHSLEDAIRMQADTVLNRARLLLPFVLEDLEGLRGFMPRELPALKLLRAWDGDADSAAPEAVIFFSIYREAIIGAMVDEVDARGLDYLLSQRYFTNPADLWFSEADHPVWDDRRTAPVEQRGDVVRAAFRKAIQDLRDSLGSDPESWRWGSLHSLHFRHVFGAKIDSFNLETFEAPGGPDSIWKTHIDFGHKERPYGVVAGPVYRMVVDLADLDHGLWVIDTGSSGWPGSPHYGDQFELWKRMDYAPMVMDWKEIRAGATALLTLR